MGGTLPDLDGGWCYGDSYKTVREFEVSSQDVRQEHDPSVHSGTHPSGHPLVECRQGKGYRSITIGRRFEVEGFGGDTQ